MLKNTMLKKLLATDDDPVMTVLRVLLGVVFFPHGAQKLLGWFGGYGYHGTMGYFEKTMPAFLAFLVIFTEFFGALGLITGLLTRLSALAIGVEMIVAVLLVHVHNGFFMNWTGMQKGEGFEYHILVIAIAIALLIRGGGSFSIDGAIAGRPSRIPVTVER